MTDFFDVVGSENNLCRECEMEVEAADVLAADEDGSWTYEFDCTFRCSGCNEDRDLSMGLNPCRPDFVRSANPACAVPRTCRISILRYGAGRGTTKVEWAKS